MKTQDDVAAMLRLKALGWGKKRIAVELCCSPKTVCHWLTLGEWHPYGSRSRSGKLDGLSDWLRERFRLHAGNTNAVRQELAREKSITVSLRTVERAVAPLWREFFLVERARQVAFEWMRSVLQKDISLDVLRGEIGDVSEVETLLRRLYDGRLSDRNRSMVILANRRGVRTRFVCGFLGIDRTTHRKYLRSFKDGGCDALFTRQIKVTRKFDDETVKQAVFGLLHEPPSNHGINRTTCYLSWDAASWHISKGLYKRVEEHNAGVTSGNGPTVETAPLPAGAQFLNVIESVFSGMARSIIHNSDYKKIWGKEREVPEFSLANNCKDPRYR